VRFADAIGANSGFRALLGAARHIDTVAGFTAWRSLGLVSLVGGLWGLLAGTTLMRGEEDAGRWELLLAGPTTRRRAAAAGVVGLAAGWFAMLVTTAIVTVVAGRQAHPSFPVRSSLFFAVALSAAAAVFLAVGALAGQLAATRRQAAAIAAAVFAATYLLG
jgi:polyether ionophore transport system permease protein